MRINNNLMAMNTHRQLGINAGNGAKSIEKLSSGYRINRAGDDAAGLAISEKMRAQIRGLNQASRNSQDAISLVQTAEGALNESQAILQRMRELAVQSSNDTNVDSDRSEIQKEINQLTSEINRIGNTTEFNTQKLLNGGEAKTGSIRYKENVSGSPSSGDPVVGTVTNVNEATESIKAGSVAISNFTQVKGGVLEANDGTIGSPLNEVRASSAAGTGAIAGDDGRQVRAGAADAAIANGSVTINNVGTGAALSFTIDVATENPAIAKGDTITVGAKTFTAGSGGWTIGADNDATIANLATVLAADASYTTEGGADVAITANNGSITFVADTNDAGIELGNAANIINDGAGATQAAVAGEVSTADTAIYTLEVTSNFTNGDVIKVGNTDFTAGVDFTVNANDQAATVSSLKDAISTLAGYTAEIGSPDWPNDTSSITIRKDAAGDDAGNAANFVANVGVTKTPEVKGQYKFEIATEFEAGQTVNIDGEIFTAVKGAATAADGEFSIDGAIDATADSLLAAINANATLAAKFDTAILEDGNGGAGIGASGLATDGDTIVLQEKNASGKAMTGVFSDLDAGSIKVNNVAEVKGQYSFEITSDISRGDKITIGTEEYTAGTAQDVLDGKANYELGANNTATIANLVTAIDAGAYDATQGDSAFVTGNKITLEQDVASATNLAGVTGTKATEVRGSYEFQISTNLTDGERMVIDGVGLVAGTDFTVGADADATAAALKGAIDADATLSAKYDVSLANNQLTLTEKAGQADGVTLAKPALSRNAVAGEFEFTMVEQSKGGSVEIDGEKLTFATGGTVAESAKELKSLIEGNTALNAKYSVAVKDTNLTLTQKTGQESETAPEIAYTTAAGSGFNATMQIGANTGQSMNITMGDMRADALDVSSADGAAQFVEVDGKQYQVAWTAAKTVNSGTENVETEFALDVSTSDNATTAVEVINNAINQVSGERSKLGAFQNRLEHTIKNLDTSAENLQASESRIRDVDMAKEMMTFTKNNILQQAAQSMLAQANQAPQGVLQLLR